MIYLYNNLSYLLAAAPVARIASGIRLGPRCPLTRLAARIREKGMRTHNQPIARARRGCDTLPTLHTSTIQTHTRDRTEPRLVPKGSPTTYHPHTYVQAPSVCCASEPLALNPHAHASTLDDRRNSRLSPSLALSRPHDPLVVLHSRTRCHTPHPSTSLTRREAPASHLASSPHSRSRACRAPASPASPAGVG